MIRALLTRLTRLLTRHRAATASPEPAPPPQDGDALLRAVRAYTAAVAAGDIEPYPPARRTPAPPYGRFTDPGPAPGTDTDAAEALAASTALLGQRQPPPGKCRTHGTERCRICWGTS